VTAPQDPPPPQPETQKISPEDLARMLEASGTNPPPGNGRALRRKIVVAVLIAAVGVGASIMSCVGQSFSLRQARAMEGIEQQLKQIRAICPKGP
jgi:hypothetical protein